MLLALTACASITIPRVEDTPTPAPTQVRKAIAPTAILPTPTPELPDGGTLAIGVVGKMTLELNVMPGIVQETVFDSLLQVNATTGALEPALAKSFQVSEDATTFTFRLRQNVRWHTGDAFTADDVVTAINAFASPNFRGTPVTDFGVNPRVIALDDATVQITFGEGYCPALTSVGTLPIVPRAVARATNFPRLTPAQMIGTGPLKFVASTNGEIKLERNPDYWRGAPHLDGVTVRIFTDSTALRVAFNTKQLDLMFAAPTEFAAIKTIADARRVAVDAPESVMLVFNTETVGLNDARVRQALNYAMDRNVLLNDVSGQGRVLDALVLPGFWAQTTSLPRYAFDPAKAKQMLAEAGWTNGSDGLVRKNGKPLRLELWTEADHPILEPVAFRLREQLAAVGIQIVLQLNDRAGWMTRAFDHRFDLLLVSRKIPLDPDQHWYWQSNQNEKGNGLNIGSYTSARVDALLKDSLRVNACESSARAAITNEINRVLIGDAPAAFLFAPKRYWLVGERVAGFAPSSFAGDFWNIERWGVR
ncbi:MAG: hypothetical protein HY868_27335 [Chloroflexi bacterium]|nr:hypothetical protein [Chloroflexota bacterium]